MKGSFYLGIAFQIHSIYLMGLYYAFQVIKNRTKVYRAERTWINVDWWAHQDLNLGPLGYEPIALTTELWALRPLNYFNKPTIAIKNSVNSGLRKVEFTEYGFI
jgi:hypothetical protein